MPIDDEVSRALGKAHSKMQEMELEHAKQNMAMQNVLGLLQSDMTYIKNTLQQLVSKTEFAPVKILVYGFTGLVLSGAIGALLSLVFIHKL